MTLDKVTSLYERRRMFEYGVDGTKAVRHWYNVQHVDGPLYKSADTLNKYGEKEFNLYIIFPGADTGLLYQKMRYPERYTAEQMLAAVIRDHMDTAENMIADLDERMVRNQFIGNAQIEFIRQFDPKRAECYAQYRKDIYARRAKESREKALARQTAEDAEAARKKAELEDKKAKYLGWAEGMSPLRFGKVSVVMDTIIRVEGRLITKRDFIIGQIKDGWLPQKDEGVTSHYGSRWNPRESKPRTEYRIYKKPYSYKITKTEYDFAQYLVSLGVQQGH